MSHQQHTSHKNGSFSTSFGFVLACVGSAVGLGNIWMFPYRLGQYGGAAFLIPYLFFICLFGLTGLSAEFGIGRMARTGTLGSYELCWKSRKKEKVGKVMGWIPLLGSLGIAVGYSIIIGWVVRSLFGSITNDIFTQSSGEFFSQATGDFGSVPWHVLVIVITIVILLTGSVKQIEKANKIMMPVFFLLFAILAVRVAMLPVSYTHLLTDFSARWHFLFRYHECQFSIFIFCTQNHTFRQDACQFRRF